MTQHKTPQQTSELDMMMLRAGWPNHLATLEDDIAAARLNQARLLKSLAQLWAKFREATSMVASRRADATFMTAKP